MKYSGGIYLDIDIYVYVSSHWYMGKITADEKGLALNRLTICCTTLRHWVWKRPLTLDDLLSIPKVFVWVVLLVQMLDVYNKSDI